MYLPRARSAAEGVCAEASARDARLVGSRHPLLASEGQIGLQLDVVRDLVEENLRDLEPVVGEGRRELRPHLDVVGGEAEALLALDLLGRQLDPGDRRVGD